MSRVLYDFLNDSVLLSEEAINEEFAGVAESELRGELSRYRAHVVARQDEIVEEVCQPCEGPKTYVGAAAGGQVGRATLKRMALYFTRTVIDDPLMPLTKMPGEQNEAFAKFHGYRGAGPVNRHDLAEAAGLLRSVRPFVGIDALKIAPVSLAHEPPEGMLPINYSPTAFAERVPDDVQHLFKERVRVTPLVQVEGGGWGYKRGAELKPCRAIAVEFEGFPNPMIFHLSAMRLESHPGKEGLYQMVQWIPDEPPDSGQFGVWVTQSANQFAGDIVRRIVIDVHNSIGADAMLMTTSDLVAEVLLAGGGDEAGADAEIASLSLQLTLPTVDAASEEALATVRRDHGLAFEALRLQLARSLREIRHERDTAKRALLLDDLRHELEEVQVREARLVLEGLKKNLLVDAVLGGVSLAAAIPTGGLSLLGAVTAAAKGAVAAQRARDELGKNGGVFLWKLGEVIKE